MDDTVKRLARELADAIAAAVTDDARVEACRERARAEGYEMRITLEALVGFVSRTAGEGHPGVPVGRGAGRRPLEISANDRRFLRSLRIAVDEATQVE